MNWKHAIKDYQYYLRLERGLSENSIASYTLDVEKLVDFVSQWEHAPGPVEIEEETIQQFIYHLSKQVSAQSQARVISGLRSFFSYLIFEEYRSENPMDLIESPRTTRKLPDTLSTAEIDRLIEAIDLSQPEGERNRAIIETLYSCGLRVSELVNLRISDLFFDEGFIRVTGKGNKQRFVPISPTTVKYINLYKEQVRIAMPIKKNAEDILFLNRRGTQLTRAMIFTVIKRLAQTAGLEKKVSPHTFRHSFATHLLENGADLRAIQQMLGHESITTTEIYVHTDRSHLKKIMENYHPRRSHN